MAAPPADAALEAFNKYDRNNNGFIEIEELKTLVKDLGLLKGMPPSEAATWVVTQFKLADKRSKDGKLDLEEFCHYFQKVAAPRLLEALAAEMPAELAQLRRTFANFASFGAPRGARTAGIDGARFIKLCRETKLVDTQLTTTDADLIFASVKDRPARKISFEQFLDALDLVAAKRGQPLTAVVRQVGGSDGPEVHGVTEGEWVKLHDDKSTYTGLHARRRSFGSENSQQSQGGSAAGSSRCRGGAGKAGCLPASTAGRTSAASSAGAQPNMAQADTPDVESRERLKDAFLAFASFGQGTSPVPAKGHAEMDGMQFQRLCRESGILDSRQLTATAADLAFIAKAKPLGARKIRFRQFLAAVEQLAHEKGVPKEELFAQIASCAGPSLHRTASGRSIGQQHSSGRRSYTPATPVVDIDPLAAQESGLDAEGCALHAPATAAVTDAVGKLSIATGNVINITAVAM